MKNLMRNIEQMLRRDVQELGYTGIEWDQLKEASLPPEVSFPAAFTDIVKISYSNEGINRQRALAEISISVVDEVNQDDSLAADKVLDILEKIGSCLHGKTPGDHCGPLTKSILEHIPREDNRKEYRFIFECQITDRSGEREKTYVIPKIAAIRSGLL